jgi:3-oxoisoapionate decarboxylase
MNRRAFLLTAAAAAGARAAAPRTTMGVATTSYLTFGRPRDTYDFLEQCAALGAGGIQSAITSFEPAYLAKLKARLGEHGMYFEAMAGLPRGSDNTFERTLAAARELGALCVRSAGLSQRRYEAFSDFGTWQKHVADTRAAIDRALPLVEKYGVPLALENHKDWTAAEFVALLREKKHPLLGVCLDTGNNISLLDDPMEVVETLAPWAVSVHLKDMGVAAWENGFLLSEMPFGEGMLDLRKIVSMVRAARPQARITLEMITRNPLEVPCLTEKYWATFPTRNGRALARTLRMVAGQKNRQALPRVDHLTRDAALRLEDDNVRQCLHYARTQLGLV